MSMKDLVKRYETVPPEGNPRKSEAWALNQAALRMKAAQESGDEDAMLVRRADELATMDDYPV